MEDFLDTQNIGDLEPKDSPPSNLPPLPTYEETEREIQENGCGMFKVLSANETITEAAKRPDPKPLWLSLWYEGEVCCLYADSNVGKSVYAVQIATSIAQNEKVLYFDFELSDKQFQLRYTDDSGNAHQFPDNLFRSEINPDTMEVEVDFESAVIRDIEKTALIMGINIIIIDNLTWLCNASQKGEAAGLLMKSLMGLKRKHGWSFLVIAHTPKRSLTNPITQNDLAGSKIIFNFLDSAFSIGFSAKDDGLRYIKQTKVRSGELLYNSQNVIVCSIEKIGSFTQFNTIGYATEKEHLQSTSTKEEIALQEAVYNLHLEGKSYRVIANQLGISKGKVEGIMKKYK
ncbi:MAG: AAA family ATPase [Alphaproteobacteria bacterium]|nr:AAA family ATPase [Alphaproteobacteria bacterium]